MSDANPFEKLDEALRNNRAQSASKRLVEALTQRTEIFAGDDGKIYASLDPARKYVVVDIEGQEFLDHVYLLADELGLSATRNSIAQIVPLLRARARKANAKQPVFKRFGHLNGTIYIDRCTEHKSIVEISKAGGVKVCETCPVRFVRTADMAKLPLPDLAGSLHELRPLLPQIDDGNFRKLEAAILAAAHPTGPYLIVDIIGEHNTGKTTVLRLARSIFDPRSKDNATRSLASTAKDLWVQAYNEPFLGFDNVTRIPPSLEDELCQISTGGALSNREHYTNDRQVVLSAKRPIFMTSIGIPTSREDVLNRMLIIHVANIPEGKRRSEESIDAEFSRKYPRIFGGYCKALAACLRNKGRVVTRKTVRMQDALEWVAGAESELGWPPGTFERLYTNDQQEIMDGVLEDDPLGSAIIKLVETERQFSGTATELGSSLLQYRSSGSQLPGRNDIRNRLLRLSPLLKARGIAVEVHRTSDRRRERLITIRRIIRIPRIPTPKPK